MKQRNPSEDFHDAFLGHNNVDKLVLGTADKLKQRRFAADQCRHRKTLRLGLMRKAHQGSLSASEARSGSLVAATAKSQVRKPNSQFRDR
jgi:hypothetical protein